METLAQKGSLSAPARLLGKKTLMKFSDATPDEAQQGAIPRQCAEMRLAAARRHPCASQPGNKFSASSGSDVSCYVMSGSAVVIRMVRLESLLHSKQK